MIKFKIHILMAEKRMTQKDVMNKYYYGTIVRIPTLHIDKLCKLFNCQPNDLFEYIPDNENVTHE